MLYGKKTILIAGASSGIGKACAERLSKSGYKCVLVARNVDKLNDIRQKIGEDSYIYAYDLFDADNIKSIFEFCKDNKLKLDGMIYSAGMLAECPVKANQLSLLQKSIQLHCVSFYEMCKYFYSKKYSQEGASVVAISSISSLLCEQGMGPYSVAKAALDAAVKTISKEFLRRRIRVNGILPAGVDTPMAQQKRELRGVDDAHAADGQALGLIKPENVASLVEYLLSDEACFITGDLIPISAGMDF